MQPELFMSSNTVPLKKNKNHLKRHFLCLGKIFLFVCLLVILNNVLETELQLLWMVMPMLRTVELCRMKDSTFLFLNSTCFERGSYYSTDSVLRLVLMFFAVLLSCSLNIARVLAINWDVFPQLINNKCLSLAAMKNVNIGALSSMELAQIL